MPERAARTCTTRTTTRRSRSALDLLGAFIVEPKDPSAIEKVDVDYVLILNDGVHGYTLNGKSFPATEPLVASSARRCAFAS